jgi:hypothetical protein
MNPLRIAFMAALLSASSAYADTAPHWTAAIGTGHASESTSHKASAAPSRNTTGVTTVPHWSAFIGTGRAEANRLPAAKPSAGGSPTATAHWASRIGTGHASESSSRAESAITTVRARP